MLLHPSIVLSALLLLSACGDAPGRQAPSPAASAPSASTSAASTSSAAAATGSAATGSAASPLTAAEAVSAGAASEQPSFTQGAAAVITPSLLACKGGRVAALGEIKSEDGKLWTVPTKFNASLPNAADLFNPCTNVQPASLAAVNLNNIPVTEIDADGTIITGYIFADNYFELYVNGKPVAKDAVPFTPFNSHIVRFKAKYPMTYAIKAVDWEENLGLGTEENKGSKYYPGDAGIVATFSDGTVTDSRWKAQSFYIAPLTSKAELAIESKNGVIVHSTARASVKPGCTTACFAAHFAVPDNWYAVGFDDGSWPQAVTYSTREVGVDNKKEYTNFQSEFSKGAFVWTSNLVLDNEILLRRTVEKPSK